MGLFDSILSDLAGNEGVAGLAAKVGLSPQQVEMALAALGRAHQQPGDTVAQASQETGLPQDKLGEILGHVGGEGALGGLAGML